MDADDPDPVRHAAPHEFALNLPAALAELRQDSWERLVGPRFLARAFHRHGVALAAALVLATAALFTLIAALPRGAGAGFYAYVPHGAMVLLFTPALLALLLALHLGSVLTLFLLLPYTKMVHGFFRLTALMAEEAKRASHRPRRPARPPAGNKAPLAAASALPRGTGCPADLRTSGGPDRPCGGSDGGKT